MKVEIAKNVDATRRISWQAAFPATTKCCKCGMHARLGFVAHEEHGEESYVSSLYSNEEGKMWLHDACAVAVYFCEKCLGPTALYNQG